MSGSEKKSEEEHMKRVTRKFLEVVVVQSLESACIKAQIAFRYKLS